MTCLLTPLAVAQEPEPEKKSEKSVLFIVAGVRQDKTKWLALDRELRTVPGIKRVDVLPVDDEEFCQARAVYEGAEPKAQTLVDAARRAGFDAMTLEQAKARFAGDPSKRILLDIKDGVMEKEDAINLEIPMKQVDGVKRVIVIFGETYQDYGSAIVIVTYDKQKPSLQALIDAAKRAEFEATERKAPLPSGTKKK